MTGVMISLKCSSCNCSELSKACVSLPGRATSGVPDCLGEP